MKIGILTFCSSGDNYGQILQCYALQHYLLQQGHDAFLIRYEPSYSQEKIEEGNKTIQILKSIARKLAIWRKFYLLSPSLRKQKEEGRKEHELYRQAALDHKLRQFDKFRNEFIKVSEQIYHSPEELNSEKWDIDILICGSDQIWHPNIILPAMRGWFLDFGGQKILRLSYAASISRVITNEEEIAQLKKYLAAFNAISVRERQALILLRNCGFDNVKLVLDPTFLLDGSQYMKLISNSECMVDSNSIYMYVLNVRTPDEIHFQEIDDYAKSHELSITYTCSSGYYPARDIIPEKENFKATIPEWLCALSRSKLVVTTSFHGMALSIILHKPFVVIPNTKAYSHANDRMITTLESLGLIDRMWKEGQGLKDILDTEINWELVESKLKKLRLDSINFLTSNLSKNKHES